MRRPISSSASFFPSSRSLPLGYPRVAPVALTQSQHCALNNVNTQFLHLIWGAHAPSRAGDGALAIANFLLSGRKDCFGDGAETNTRGACAPQKIIPRHKT